MLFVRLSVKSNVKYKVVSSSPHYDFSQETFGNDMMILGLSTSVDLNTTGACLLCINDKWEATSEREDGRVEDMRVYSSFSSKMYLNHTNKSVII